MALLSPPKFEKTDLVVDTCAFGIQFTVSRGDKEWSYLKNKKQKKHSEKNYILTVKM